LAPTCLKVKKIWKCELHKIYTTPEYQFAIHVQQKDWYHKGTFHKLDTEQNMTNWCQKRPTSIYTMTCKHSTDRVISKASNTRTTLVTTKTHRYIQCVSKKVTTF